MGFLLPLDARNRGRRRFFPPLSPPSSPLKRHRLPFKKMPTQPKAFHVLEWRQHNGRPVLSLPCFLPIKIGEGRARKKERDREKEERSRIGIEKREPREKKEKKKKKRRKNRGRNCENRHRRHLHRRQQLRPATSIAASSTVSHCRSAFFPLLLHLLLLLHCSLCV